MAIPSGYEDAYPRELWERERALIGARRGQSLDSAERPPADTLGVALSGGGIRSATFCLGVFQAFAQFGLLSRIDYLSTVSGGGYFGAFLGRLFSRPEVRTTAEVEQILSGAPGSPPKPAKGALPDAVGWLRENGRYLSPNGSGDLMQAGAGMVRNWTAIQVVMLSFFVMLFLTAQMVRALVEVSFPVSSDAYAQAVEWWLPGRALIWWSPYILMWLIPFLVGAVPLGWAYWMIGRVGSKGWFFERPVFSLIVAAVLTVALILNKPGPRWTAAAWGLLALQVLTVSTWAGAYWTALRHARRKEAREVFRAASDPKRAAQIFEDDESRNTVSAWLKAALTIAIVVFAFALIDSISQTIYLAVATRRWPSLPLWVGSALSTLVILAGLARKLVIMFSGRVGGKRPSVPVSIVATLVALFVVSLLLVVTDTVAHAMAWSFKVPGSAPWYWLEGLPPAEVSQHKVLGDLLIPALTWGVMVLFALLFGWSWPFLNGSSQQPLYSARLTRAYLGASNPLRADPTNQKVSRVLPGDNTDLANYYPAASHFGPHKGPPLHLINVTLNETVDGKSQIEQRDRKGVGLAIGPRSFSAGVRHHAVFSGHGRQERRNAQIFPAAGSSGGSAPFQMFWHWRGGEELSLGFWIGISGAAFSTGLGARTNLGLSLLCGLSNVRLGYWWDSQVEPSKRPQWSPTARKRMAAFVTRWVFLVQTCLLDEFLARFPGSAARRWYLSDGGHFENLGGYELIRRRLPRILLVDAEADPEYTFEGLANLVRKARLDFRAEITFLTAAELDATLDPAFRPFFGTLEQLRRGKWSGATDPRGTGGARLELDAVDLDRLSLAHAAIARVVYQDEPERVSYLVYMKPTLTGDEPVDITQYHGAHSSFPQETTSDQFFDEAQWESYRRLGFEIASDLFHAGTSGSNQSPRGLLFDPPPPAKATGPTAPSPAA